MYRADVLATLDRRILQAYSGRTTLRLREKFPVRVALPPLDRFLAMNVAKEARKDALVIRRASEAYLSGIVPDRAMLGQLLHGAREIDRMFLNGVAGIPFGIVIRYEEIDPIRSRRIECLLGLTQKILECWHGGDGARMVLRKAYSHTELENFLRDLMRLHARETRALSRSLRLPALLAPLRDRVGRLLFDAMNDAAAGLARDVADAVHRRRLD